MTKTDKEGQRKTPILRFKGFTDDWEQRELREIAKKRTEKNRNLLTNNVLSNSAIYGIVKQTEYFDKSIANNIQNYYLVYENDFVYNPRISNNAPFGPISRNKLNELGIMSPLYLVFYFSTKSLSDYLEIYFKSSKWHKFMYMNGNSGARSDRFAIKDNDFFRMKIKMPHSKDEINKIYKFNILLYKLLTLYERKLKLLSQVKKYFLDNLFAKKEYPNLRFKGYEDTWLKSKFSKFLSIPEKVKVTIDSPSRILTVKLNLGGVQKGANRTTLKLNSTTYYLRKAGQLIYGKQNLFNGSLAIIPSQFEGYVTSGDVPSLNINNIDKRFLYYYIARKSFYKKTEAYSSGTGSKRIHEKTFLGFNIVYPEDLKEQEKISKLISSINSNIELYRSKKNNLMAIKKNLLNAMFI